MSEDRQDLFGDGRKGEEIKSKMKRGKRNDMDTRIILRMKGRERKNKEIKEKDRKRKIIEAKRKLMGIIK